MFNALRYTQELEKAGFNREQAEAAVNMVHQFTDQNLATKTDVLELKHSIESLEYRMTIKLGSLLIMALGALVALQKLS